MTQNADVLVVGGVKDLAPVDIHGRARLLMVAPDGTSSVLMREHFVAGPGGAIGHRAQFSQSLGQVGKYRFIWVVTPAPKYNPPQYTGVSRVVVTQVVKPASSALSADVSRAATSATQHCRQQDPLIRVCTSAARVATYPMLQVPVSSTIHLLGNAGDCVPLTVTTTENAPDGVLLDTIQGTATACVGQPLTVPCCDWQNGPRFSPFGTWTLTTTVQGGGAYQAPSSSKASIDLQSPPSIPLTCAAPGTITFCAGLFDSFPDDTYTTTNVRLGDLIAGEIQVNNQGCGCKGISYEMSVRRPDGSRTGYGGLIYWPGSTSISAVPYAYQALVGDLPGTYRFTLSVRPKSPGAA